jgi:hypothetical protein
MSDKPKRVYVFEGQEIVFKSNVYSIKCTRPNSENFILKYEGPDDAATFTTAPDYSFTVSGDSPVFRDAASKMICKLKQERLESEEKLKLEIEEKVQNLAKLMSQSATKRIISKLEIERLLNELLQEHSDCRRRLVNLKMRTRF